MSSYILRTEKKWGETLADLEDTFRLWGIHEWTVTPMRPRSRGRYQGKDERRVTLHYLKDGAEIDLPMDQQDRAEDNLRVLYLAVEAMRMNEKRGIADVVRDAYLQLPAPLKVRDPYEVLGVRSDSPIEVVEAAYRALAKQAHPDAGGSTEVMTSLNEAVAQIRKERE